MDCRGLWRTVLTASLSAKTRTKPLIIQGFFVCTDYLPASLPTNACFEIGLHYPPRMNPATESTYRDCMAKWVRADPQQRTVRRTRDTRGWEVVEYVSYGVVRVRKVRDGSGWLVYTHKAGPQVSDPGKISFTSWMEAEMINGTGRRSRPAS